MPALRAVALRGRSRRRWAVALLVLVALLSFGASWLWLRTTPPAHVPRLVSSYPNPAYIGGVSSTADLLFIASKQGLIIRRLTTPLVLQVVPPTTHHNHWMAGPVRARFVWSPDRRWLYVLADRRLWSADVRDPHRAVLSYQPQIADLHLSALVATTDVLYALDEDQRDVIVLDARQPQRIQRHGRLDGSQGARALALQDQSLFLAFTDRVCRYSLETRLQPNARECWSLPAPLAGEQAPILIAQPDALLVLAATQLTALAWSATQPPTLLGQFELPTPADTAAFDAETRQLYISDGDRSCNQADTLLRIDLRTPRQIGPVTEYNAGPGCVVTVEIAHLGVLVLTSSDRASTILRFDRSNGQAALDDLIVPPDEASFEELASVDQRLYGLDRQGEVYTLGAYDARAPELLTPIGPTVTSAADSTALIDERVCFTATATRLALVSRTGELLVFAIDRFPLQLSGRYNFGTPMATCSALPSGEALFTASRQGELSLWDVRQPQPQRLSTLPACPALSFEPDATLRVVAADGWLALFNRPGHTICIYNVRTPATPHLVQTLQVGDDVRISDVAIAAQRFYLLADQGLTIYRFQSDGTLGQPQPLRTPRGEDAILVTGEQWLISHMANVAEGDIRIYDRRDADRPRLVACLPSPAYARSMLLAEPYYYVASNQGLDVYDLGTLRPDAPGC